MNPIITPNPLSRRSFLHRGAAGIAGAALVKGFPHIVNAQESQVVRIGLVGCGGRGSGALTDSMNADPNVRLVAMGDVHADRLETSFNNITSARPDQVKVPDNQKFVGFDAIDRVLATDIDIVLLATPPGFRPEHLQKVVDAGKHAFCEKPCATDAPGVKRFLAATAERVDGKPTLVFRHYDSEGTVKHEDRIVAE